MKEEFEIFRESLITSLARGKGVLETSYKDNNISGYYGGIALLKNLYEIRVNKIGDIEVEALYVSQQGNTRENPGFKPKVEHDACITWRPEYIGNQVTFQINNSDFVPELKKVIRDYKNQNILSQARLKPYYLPLFMKPISKALSNASIELVFPKDEKKKKKAVRHLIQ